MFLLVQGNCFQCYDTLNTQQETGSKIFTLLDSGKKSLQCRRRIYYKVMDLRMFHKISEVLGAFL